MSHVKFPSIEGFTNTWKYFQKKYQFPERPVVTYQPKIKLHGTYAGVRIEPNGDVIAQGRNRDLAITDDNYGFAAWALRYKDFWKAFTVENQRVVVHGEWAGPGIQKNVAVSKLEEKQFFVFAVQYDDKYVVHNSVINAIVRQADKNALLQTAPDRLHVLPFHGSYITIDFNDPEAANAIVEQMNAEVDAIDKIDPYIKDKFGVEACGEGLVYYPVDYFGFPTCHHLFKVKGASHAEKGAAKPARMSATASADAIAFAKEHVHPARCEQGRKEIFGEQPIESKGIGAFIGWVAKDVAKECEEELLASGLEWKQVQSQVVGEARQWLFEQMKREGLT